MLFYFLNSHPAARASLTSELDQVFGPDSQSAATRIRASPRLLNNLLYTTAAIKETLRLFPPANTVRVGNPSVSVIDSNGIAYPTEPLPGTVVWPDSWVIGRDEKMFPEPRRFIPERWIAGLSKWPVPPPAAFRAFERGPRNCIGMEFGMLEVKVVAAMCVRDFEFVPGYAEDAPAVNGEKCYQMLFGSAKPKSGVPGRMVRLRPD